MARTNNALVHTHGGGLHARHEAAAVRERARAEARQVLPVQRCRRQPLGHGATQLRGEVAGKPSASHSAPVTKEP